MSQILLRVENYPVGNTRGAFVYVERPGRIYPVAELVLNDYTAFHLHGSIGRKTGNPSNALCFDYDSLKSMLDLNLETFRMTEDEMNADDNDNDNNDSPLSDNTIQEPELPF